MLLVHDYLHYSASMIPKRRRPPSNLSASKACSLRLIAMIWSPNACAVCVQDFSDLVAQKAAQQKRKAAQAKESGKSKKQKSDTFKF